MNPDLRRPQKLGCGPYAVLFNLLFFFYADLHSVIRYKSLVLRPVGYKCHQKHQGYGCNHYKGKEATHRTHGMIAGLVNHGRHTRTKRYSHGYNSHNDSLPLGKPSGNHYRRQLISQRIGNSCSQDQAG